MEIKDLGQDTFLAGKKIIKAGIPGMFDLSIPADQEELARISENLYTGGFEKPCFGPLTVCVLYPVRQGSGRKAKYDENQMHPGYLPDNVKAVLRKEMPEYADAI